MRTGGVGASAATVAADGADATDAAAASRHAGQALAQGLCGDSMCVAATALAAAAAAAAANDDAAPLLCDESGYFDAAGGPFRGFAFPLPASGGSAERSAGQERSLGWQLVKLGWSPKRLVRRVTPYTPLAPLCTHAHPCAPMCTHVQPLAPPCTPTHPSAPSCTLAHPLVLLCTP